VEKANAAARSSGTRSTSCLVIGGSQGSRIERRRRRSGAGAPRADSRSCIRQRREPRTVRAKYKGLENRVRVSAFRCRRRRDGSRSRDLPCRCDDAR
jgi:hypothetical protein